MTYRYSSITSFTIVEELKIFELFMSGMILPWKLQSPYKEFLQRTFGANSKNIFEACTIFTHSRCTTDNVYNM